MITRLMVMLCMFALSMSHAMAEEVVWVNFMNDTHLPVKRMLLDDEDMTSDIVEDLSDGSVDAYERKQVAKIRQVKKSGCSTCKIIIQFQLDDGSLLELGITEWFLASPSAHSPNRICKIDIMVDGKTYDLLQHHGRGSKCLAITADQLAHADFTSINGTKYQLWVDTQKDHTGQYVSFNSIYFTLTETDPKEPKVDPVRPDEDKLGVITYNIQAFPDNWGGGWPYPNKRDERMKWIAGSPRLKYSDVLVFTEAWDNHTRDFLRKEFEYVYPYYVDPAPKNTHDAPLGSGLLVLSRYPIIEKGQNAHRFVNYRDIVDPPEGTEDIHNNKGALYFRVDKFGIFYNLIATQTQWREHGALRGKADKTREAQIGVLSRMINFQKKLTPGEPLIIVGDLNINAFSIQYPKLKETLGFTETGIENTVNREPKYTFDTRLNLMAKTYTLWGGPEERAKYDYIMPVGSFMQPSHIETQITPLRAFDTKSMYRRVNWTHRTWGNIETSYHFPVQAVFTYPPR